MPCVNRLANGSARRSGRYALQRAGPEAGIEQVQDRMLDPADVLLDRQPARDLLGIERLVRRLAGEAQEIPRAVDESVERVGLALAPACRIAGNRRASRSDGAAAGCPARRKSTSSGRVTGSWSLGTGTTPQASQWMNGIGVPQ
jgi:hypothetical protein